MNDLHLEDSIFGSGDPQRPVRSRREAKVRQQRNRPKRGRNLLVLVVAVALLAGGGYALWPALKGAISSLTGGDTSTADTDFPGPGEGTVRVTIKAGQTGEDIASTLKAAGVVKTRTAYLNAANADPAGAGKIQAGTYVLKKGMTGLDAFKLLLDPTSRAKGVTVREGLWAVEVYPILSKATGIPVADYTAAAKNPTALGVPASADGKIEGWLFPSTYDFPDKMPAADQLKAMVAQTKAELKKAGVAEKDWEKTLILASLVEAEARLDVDRPKIARVFLNRIDNVGKGPTYGLIQSDASVSYGAHRRAPFPSKAELADRSNPYNLNFEPGLPPGPISNPGAKSIEAASHPADGPWFFFAAVNLVTGETEYATTMSEWAVVQAHLQKFCQENPGNGC